MGTTEEELHYIIQDLGIKPYYLGTFDKTFPGFINKKKMCCAIVNTAHRSTGGMHWLAMAWHPPNSTFYLFDPYGFSDAKLNQIYQFEYEALLKRSAIFSTADRCITLIKSTESVQGQYSAACGLFCCVFLYAFVNWPNHPLKDNFIFNSLHGIPTSQLTNPIYQKILYNNQQFVYKFLLNYSPYFKKNAKKIMFQTSFNKALEITN